MSETDGNEGDGSPFLDVLQAERKVDREAARISWQTAQRIREKYDAEAAGDADRVAELTREIGALIARRRALFC